MHGQGQRSGEAKRPVAHTDPAAGAIVATVVQQQAADHQRRQQGEYAATAAAAVALSPGAADVNRPQQAETPDRRHRQYAVRDQPPVLQPVMLRAKALVIADEVLEQQPQQAARRDERRDQIHAPFVRPRQPRGTLRQILSTHGSPAPDAQLQPRLASSGGPNRRDDRDRRCRPVAPRTVRAVPATAAAQPRQSWSAHLRSCSR